MSRRVYKEIEGLSTESVHPRSVDLDIFSIKQILEFMSDEDATVSAAVRKKLPQIESVIERVVASFQSGGRLIYIGAGTSGRLGIVDASECPPTFGSDPGQVIGIIAGGPEAVFRSQEGAEDNAEMGKQDLIRVDLRPRDTVVGITASTRTPYVLGALRYARTVGASRALLVCNPSDSDAEPSNPDDIVVSIDLGPEVIMGSTRLKAGTATKMVLNMITTAAFIRCGHVYRGMMVDLKAWSEKLAARSRKILMLAAGLDYDEADKLLKQANGSVKTAIVMALCKVQKEVAEDLLQQSDGFVRAAIQKKSPEKE